MRVDLYGCCVELPTSVELPLPVASDHDRPVLKVQLGALEDPAHVYDLDDMVSLSVSPGRVAIEPLQPLGPQALDHYLVDHAVPTGLSCDGHLIVHSACLERDGKAVVLLGPSGAGKSTLAKALVEASWRLLGDDSVRLHAVSQGTTPVIEAWSSYPGLRLNTDVLTSEEAAASSVVAEYASKRRVFPERADAVATSTAVLVVELGSDGPLQATALGPAKRAAALASQLFLPPASPVEGLDRLGRASDVAASLGGTRLDYPRTEAGALAVANRLAAWLDSTDSTGVAWPASS